MLSRRSSVDNLALCPGDLRLDTVESRMRDPAIPDVIGSLPCKCKGYSWTDMFFNRHRQLNSALLTLSGRRRSLGHRIAPTTILNHLFSIGQDEHPNSIPMCSAFTLYRDVIPLILVGGHVHSGVTDRPKYIYMALLQ